MSYYSACETYERIACIAWPCLCECVRVWYLLLMQGQGQGTRKNEHIVEMVLRAECNNAAQCQTAMWQCIYMAACNVPSNGTRSATSTVKEGECVQAGQGRARAATSYLPGQGECRPWRVCDVVTEQHKV